MKVVFKETFVKRFEKQLSFIAKDNPSRAQRFKTNLLTQIKKIPQNPYRYRRSIYFDLDEVRDLIFKGYTIVFRITESQIEIFGFVKYQNSATE